ncbi:hypothetical protein ACFQ05_26650 [Amycolatopsis umgeniensis]|uniref:Uncharacterized protein n=1 Tax=Amycolatopsis umgeniensis TaxID=336628 RepID=A0A841BCA3_9PSEU|nr:hypothetical protein [Amycolatopsis umgeniensis]MBB5856465.1 hypothetical protein [Amycolatopsis umgeniensis]
MTDRETNDLHPTEMPIDELTRRSSAGGRTDPDLDDVCTDVDATRFIATLDVSQLPHVPTNQLPITGPGPTYVNLRLPESAIRPSDRPRFSYPLPPAETRAADLGLGADRL